MAAPAIRTKQAKDRAQFRRQRDCPVPPPADGSWAKLLGLRAPSSSSPSSLELSCSAQLISFLSALPPYLSARAEGHGDGDARTRHAGRAGSLRVGAAWG